MLNEAIETSAGNPTKVGESIRVVGMNPYIGGSEGKEGNRLRNPITDLGVHCYTNTGVVGTDDSVDVGVEETFAILESVDHSTIE